MLWLMVKPPGSVSGVVVSSTGWPTCSRMRAPAEAPPFPHRLLPCWLRPNFGARRSESKARWNYQHGPAPTVRGSRFPWCGPCREVTIGLVGALRVADLAGPVSGRNLSEVPRFYRSRLDANRSALAQRSGASAASELAVERALDWLARHQDDDGRWDGGIARYEDGTAVKGDDDFTVHCPAGQTCFGECAYWEADTALTGLALLDLPGRRLHAQGRQVRRPRWATASISCSPSKNPTATCAAPARSSACTATRWRRWPCVRPMP